VHGDVSLSVQPPLATIIFDRPRVRNALTSGMIEQFAKCVRQLAGRPDVRAVIVTGRPPSFTTGADQREVAQHLDDEFGRWLAESMGTALDELDRLEPFTVAVLAGDALGGGAEIAIRCDYRIAEPDARIAFVQGSNGLTTAWGGGPALVRLVGRSRALALLLSGREIEAEEALLLRVVDEIVPAGAGVPAAVRLCAQIAECEPAVLRAVRHCVDEWARLPADAARGVEVASFVSLWGGPAHRAATERWRTSR
jgi:enoyl-CoA hydratase/carnithine racemase